MQTQKKKESKRKGGNICKETTTNKIMMFSHDVSMTLGRLNFFVQNQLVFHSIVMCFAFSSKVLLFF